MILPDANVLLYAANSDSPRHEASLRALQRVFSDDQNEAGFVWVVLLAFLRLSTRPGIFERPLSVQQALDEISAWLEQPNACIVNAPAGHHAILSDLLLEAGTAGNLTTDAHLAAISKECDAEVLTYDRDFARFSGVRWRSPE